MTNNVVGVNINGDIVVEYENFLEASKATGYNLNTLYWRSYKCKPSENGLVYLKRDSLESIIQKYNFKDLFTGVTILEEVPKRKTYMKKGNVNHVIQYKTRFGVVCITPCPFISDYEGITRPKVGSQRCIQCACFVDKDQEQHFVKCSFNKSGFKNTICKAQ